MAKSFFVPIIIFLVVFILYAYLPSNQYTAVDGSLRCLPCFNSTQWHLHQSNHMLYPVNVMLWSRLMSALFNMKPQDPFIFIRMIELMNSFFAAIGVALFFLIIKKITSSPAIGILSASALACSNAFIINAVNSNEPMVGFTFSITSVVFVYLWLDLNRIFFGFISALLLSLSMATYQTMILIAPSLILLVLLFSLRDSKVVAVKNFILYAFFIFITYLLIYFLSHWLITGERSFGELIRKMFLFGYFEVYGVPKLTKFLVIPLGIIYGIVHLDNMQDGIRSFFSDQPFNITVLTGILFYMLMVVFLAVLMYISFRIFKKLSQEKAIYLIVSIAGLLSTLFAPLMLSLVYTKLLMQPIAILIAITALVVSETSKLPNRKFSNIFKIFLFIFLIFIISWNLKNVLLKMHFQPSNTKDASQVSELLDDESLIVLDWDSEIANLYTTFYKKPLQRVFSVSYQAHMLNRNRERFVQELEKEIESFKDKGKKVYFLGVLEKSRTKWRYFLEERLNIDYSIFDDYRKAAKLIKKFGNTSLYELPKR